MIVFVIKQAECQGDGDDMLLPGEEGVAEYDSYLEEAAGRILPPLAGLVGGQMFLSKFEPILPTLLKKLVIFFFLLPYMDIE